MALELFGPSLVGVRLFAALALSIAMVLAGLMARELGGSRLALIVTALAVAIAPMSLSAGALFQYVSFDYLWWVLIAYLTIRLLKSEDPHWWLGIGAVAGLGMMTKYTIRVPFLDMSPRHLRADGIASPVSGDNIYQVVGGEVGMIVRVWPT